MKKTLCITDITKNMQIQKRLAFSLQIAQQKTCVYKRKYQEDCKSIVILKNHAKLGHS